MGTLPRNDLRHYDALVDEWWRPDGAFAALHWLAAARAALIPPSGDGLLVDIGCGGGLLAPHLAGYRHVGIDLAPSAARLAAAHGVTSAVGDAARIPLEDGVADVVVAGEIFEHVEDLEAIASEAMRVCKSGGLLVFDTINRTLLAEATLVWLGERIPGGPPPGLHDPDLFVPPEHLRTLLLAGGASRVETWGLRPSLPDLLRFLVDRRHPVPMVRTRSEAVLYQGLAWKA